MNLNKKIKEAVINGLVADAVAKNAGPMADAAEALNKLWRKELTEWVSLHLPEVPQKRWASLIQDGMMVAQGGQNMYLVSYDRGEDDENYKFQTSCSSIGTSISHRLEKADWPKRVFKAFDDRWSRFKAVFDTSAGNYSVSCHYTPSFADLPNLAMFSRIYEQAYQRRPEDPIQLHPEKAAFSQSVEHLVKRATELAEKWKMTFEQASELMANLNTMIQPLRTDRQLLDLLPEAAKYLPKEPGRKGNQVAPKELFDDIRSRLAAGIPI